jgi:hypothetical protein
MNTLLQVSLFFGLIALAALVWLIIRAFRKHTLWGIAVLLLSPFSALFFGIKYWRDEKQPFLAYMTSFATATGLALYVFTAWGGWEVARLALKVHSGIQAERLSQQDAFDFMHANLRFIEKASPDELDRRKVEVIREFLDQHESKLSGPDRAKLYADVVTLMDDQGLSTARYQDLENMRKQLAAKQVDSIPQETQTPVAAAPESNRRIQSRRPSKTKVNYRADYREIDISEAGKYIGKSFKVTRRNSEERQCRLIGRKPGKLVFEQRGGGGTFTFEYRYSDIEKLKLLARMDNPD